MEVKTGSFRAIGNDGKEYIVDMFQNQARAEGFEGGETVDTLSALRLRDGRKLNRTAKGQYVTWDALLTLTSDSPVAP